MNKQVSKKAKYRLVRYVRLVNVSLTDTGDVHERLANVRQVYAHERTLSIEL